MSGTKERRVDDPCVELGSKCARERDKAEERERDGDQDAGKQDYETEIR